MKIAVPYYPANEQYIMYYIYNTETLNVEVECCDFTKIPADVIKINRKVATTMEIVSNHIKSNDPENRFFT